MKLPNETLNKMTDRFFEASVFKFIMDKHPAAITNPKSFFDKLGDKSDPLHDEFKNYITSEIDRLKIKFDLHMKKKKERDTSFEF